MELNVLLTADETRRVLREALKVLGMRVEGLHVTHYELNDATEIYNIILSDQKPDDLTGG